MSAPHPLDPEARILDRSALLYRYGRPRDGRLVFTNGCFDLLHKGHVSLLERARALGTELVVAVNSDASVRRLKGAGRPLLPVEDRAFLLAGLRAVDAVTIFEEDTPLELIRLLLPDILVKGADYRRADIVGGEVVEKAGGRVQLLALEPDRSTTEILDRIRGAGK